MSSADLEGDLYSYLRGAWETLVWKLDGLGEYDIRRPLTPTGTNLLGLVKHSAVTEVRYFGEVFGRTPDVSLPWLTTGEPNADFWAAPGETRDDIVGAYRRAWALTDATVAELPLDAVGRVPWWGGAPVTLLHVLVHVTAESQRHAGHADLLRELIDGAAGLLDGHDNLPTTDPAWWRDHHRPGRGGRPSRRRNLTTSHRPRARSRIVPKTHETPAEQGFRKWSGPASIR